MKVTTHIKNGSFVESEAFKMFIEECEGKEVELMVLSGTRSDQQNRALHKFCSILAEILNDMGLDMRKVLKPTYFIPWTTISIKDHIWRPIQKVMYSKESTKELSKHEEITNIHKVIMRELGKEHGVEYIPFPSLPDGATDEKGRFQITN